MRSQGRRRVFAVGGVVALVATLLGGCSGGGDDKKASGSGGSGAGATCPVGALKAATSPVQITFWNVMQAANAEELQREVDRFEAAHADVRVKLVPFSDYPELFDKYKSGLTTGDLPDVAQFEETTVQQLLDSKSTVPVGACVKADDYSLSDFLPRAIDYYTVDGVLQSMPWAVSNPILIYDQAKFAKAGLDPDKPPESFEEVRQYSQQIVDRGVAEHGIALRSQDYFNEFFYAKAGQAYVNNDGGRAGRATKALLDNRTGRAIWTWWQDMVESGLALAASAAAGSTDHLVATATDEAAMTIDGSGVLGPAFQVLGRGEYEGVELAAGPLPSLKAGGGVPVGDGSLWISDRASSEKRAASWALIKFLSSPEEQASLAANGGYVPVRESSTELPILREKWAAQPSFRVPYDQLLAPGGPAANGSVIGDYRGVRDAVRDALLRLVSGEQSPAAALRQAQREADAAITAYNARLSG